MDVPEIFFPILVDYGRLESSVNIIRADLLVAVLTWMMAWELIIDNSRQFYFVLLDHHFQVNVFVFKFIESFISSNFIFALPSLFLAAAPTWFFAPLAVRFMVGLADEQRFRVFFRSFNLEYIFWGVVYAIKGHFVVFPFLLAEGDCLLWVQFDIFFYLIQSFSDVRNVEDLAFGTPRLLTF